MMTSSVQRRLSRTATAAVLAAASAGWAVSGPGALASARAAAPPGTISTMAGGVGGTGQATTIGLNPLGVGFGGGRLYIANADVVREVVPKTDLLTNPAGTGGFGLEGDGGLATQARLTKAVAVAASGTGNLLISESTGQIRMVAASSGTFFGHAMTARHIYTVAGTGKSGFSGDGGPATKAKLNAPDGLALDSSGNLLIADSFNNRIRVVAAKTGTFYQQPMVAGDIYTVAGSGAPVYSGDGGPATQAGIGFPPGVAVDHSGNLVIVDSGNERIRVVAAKTGTFYQQPMVAGDIYTVAGNGLHGFSGDGGPATKAEFYNPESVAVDGAGNLLIGDQVNNRVRAVAVKTGTFYGQPLTAGDIYTVAGDGNTGFSGDGGPAIFATLDYPAGEAIDGAGNLLIADVYDARIRVVAAKTGTFYGQPMTEGDMYTIAGAGPAAVLGDGGLATKARFFDPGAVFLDAAGNMVIADVGNARIRVVAAKTGTFYGQPMIAKQIYTVAGDGAVGYAGDGGPATGAEFYGPSGVVADAAGNLLIADEGNGRIRAVAVRNGTFYGVPMVAGDVYTVAGGGSTLANGVLATNAALIVPSSVAVDSAGNLLLTDYGNNRVRVVAGSTGKFYGQAMTVGHIYTIAGNGSQGFSGDGGPATKARFSGPASVALDRAGNVLITDENNQRVRVVATRTGTFYQQPMTAGDVYTVAGDGTKGFSGDAGPAIKATFSYPVAVLADANGNLAIADLLNNRVRMVAAKTGTFYGVAMTAGNIYTIAGNGVLGFFGDGGPAVKAALDHPAGLAVGGAGHLVVADYLNERIREVSG